MASKRDFLNELVKDNGLNVDEDIFKRKFGDKDMAFITRTGIEKIQYNNHIRVTFQIESVSKDFAVVKARALMPKPDDDGIVYQDEGDWIEMETYGSAWHGQGGITPSC